jgi:hypothetical protein
MAEETLNTVENLDNQPSAFNELMAKSDFLNPATVDQPLAPKINWKDNFVNPTNYIKDNTSGVSSNYYPSSVKSDRVNGVSQGGFGAMLDRGMANINSKSDAGNYAEPYAFDASPKGTFREKYKAYGQDTYNKIGFHPLIDNEALFNQNTTFGDDLTKWATHAAGPMLAKGFMDPIRSYKSIMDGNGLFDADAASARDYEYYNAIGASSKGGTGGFIVNLFNSAAYSMGILMEGAVEGALIGALFSGGNAATGAVEGGATFLNKLGSLPKSLVQATKGTKELLTSVKNYSNLSKAKELFGSASKNFGNFINPLGNTLQAYKQLKNTDNLTNLARSATTAGALWHDVMNLNMALSEGKLEGGFTRAQTYDRLYNEFVQNHNGKGPTLEEQESMMRQSSKGAFLNTANNTALIFLSNKLAFPSITNASFLKGAPKFGFGKVVTNVGKEFQILFQPGKTALEGSFVKQRVNLVNAIKSLAKPTTYGKVGLNYFKANVVEGLQEISQDVLQEATQNYYVDTYNNPDARSYRYGTALLRDSIENQWSSQGLETFLSGFLMGTILQAPGTIKKYATFGYNDYLKKDSSYKEYLDGREELADTVVEQLNTMYKNPQYFFDNRINNYVNQSLLTNVIDDPDNHTTKEIRDTEFAAFQSAVLGSLQNGTFDSFLKHYEGYKQASATDLEEAWGLAPGQGTKALERFDKSLENAKKISTRWASAKSKMKFMANLDDYEKDSEEYRMAQIYNKAYNQALYNYVFLHEAFDNNVQREKKLYETLSSLSAIKESNFSDFTALTDPNKLQREVEMLKTEIENLEGFNTAESIGEASRKRELLEVYSNFQERQESLVDLFVNKTLLANIKNEILRENPDMSDQDASLASIDQIIKQYDNGESNEFLDYKESFANLLNVLAGDSKNRMQLEQELQEIGGIDDLFTDLLDTHILKNETSRLNEYVNLLSDPREFYQHIMRNFKFMKDLYNNREEIVKNIVNQEISAIEKNTLLNTLADQGIFIDLDEFSKWSEDPRYLPESFIDVTNNRVIDKGSIIYEDYIEIFIRAAELAEKKPAGDPFTQKQVLDTRIQTLENERGDKLNAERSKYDNKFKETYGLTEEEYLQQEAERIASEELTDDERKVFETEKELITKAIDKLASDNYVDVEAAAQVLVTEVLEKQDIDIQEFFSTQEEIQKNDKNKNKNIFNLSQKYDTSDIDDEQEAFNTRIETALKSVIYTEYATARLAEIETELSKKPAAPTIDVQKTREYLAYQEAVDSINEKYDNFVAEIKDDFKQKGVDENTPDTYTTKTEFDDFDVEFQDEITTLFDEYLVNVLMEPLDIKTNNPIEYDRLRSNWLETQAALIDSFNEQSKQNALVKAQRLAQPPVVKFIPIKINSQTTTYTISSIVKRFQKFLEDGKYPDPKKKDKYIQLTPEDIANIKDDIEGLNGYLNARVTAAEPRNIAEQTISIIEEYVINKQDELVDLVNEDGDVIGRTFKDRGPNDPIPDRTTKVAEEVDIELKAKEPFKYSPIKPLVDADGNVLPSRVENMYNQFFNDPEIVPEDRIRLFMDAFKKEAFRGWKEFKSQEKLDALENSLKTVGTYKHLEDTIQKYAFKESSDAGNYIDSLIRIFLTPNAATQSKFSEITYDSTFEVQKQNIKVSDIMSRKAFNKLFGPVTVSSPGGIITKFRLGIVDGTYMILSENVKLFDRNLRDGRGVTGEIDLLLVREDGSVAIVDIKTKALKEKDGKLVSGWKDFGDPNAKYESSTYFRAQQSIYGYQFYNSTGITPDLKLMPFDMKLGKDKIGYIEDIDLAPLVEDSQDTIDLEYLPEIENYGITKITPEIKAPIKKEAVKETTTKADIERKTGLKLKDLIFDRFGNNLEDFFSGKLSLGKITVPTNILFYDLGNGNFAIGHDGIPTNDITFYVYDGKGNIIGTVSKGEQGGNWNNGNITDQTLADKINAKYDADIEKRRQENTNALIEESDTSKNKFIDNVNKPVIFNGRIGKLVLMPDGAFGIEVTINNDISTLKLTLDTLEANLLVEKEFGTEETLQALKLDIKKISDIINAAEGLTEVYPLQKDGKNIYNGEINISEAGASLVVQTENIGQVSTVSGQVINAAFSNNNDTIATINGVKYDVLRDSSGNITVLSYMSNDESISKIDKQIGALSEKIGNLRNIVSTEDIESDKRDALITRIAKLQDQIKQLNNKRISLYESNKKMFVYGENSNAFIFALNRLPNNFQRVTRNATKANEIEDLKSIDNLSLSRLIGTAITEILSAEYPEVLDTLIENGVQGLKKSDLNTITKWAQDTIKKLESLGYTVINRGDIVDDITNQINALNDLLNDMQLINLTKNGRISKKQEAADQVFGPGSTEVQKGSSVSTNERTTRKPAEGVSRPATRTELEDIVKQAREEGLGETFEEPVEAQEELDSVEDINNATLDTIELVYEKAFLDAQKNGEDIAAIRAAYVSRLQELKTIVSIQNVAVDEYLISKNPIFTDFADEEVIVVKKTKDSITLKNIKTEESKDFTEEELIENFEKTTMEATQPEVNVEITPVDIEDSNESKDTIKDIQNDAAALAEAQEKSKASDKKSRLDKLAENSKTC